MPGLNRQGIDAPTVRLATWYNKRNLLGSTSSAPVTIDQYREHIALSKLTILTKSDESVLKLLRDNGYREAIIQYVLFTEVGYWTTDATGAYTETAPRKNNWCFSSIPWRTALEYDPTGWLHLASTTATSSAAAGATSVAVADLAKFQNVGSGSKGIVDVWSSGGTYLGKFHYTALSGSSGAGTLTVPTSGYGAIGYNPTTLSGVGGTNPQTGSPWALPTLTSIPSGAVLRGRIRSGAVSSSNVPNTGHHFFFGDPTSATFRAWCKASLTAYRVSALTGANPTNLWGTGTGSGGAGTGHVFLDNLHTDAEKVLGLTNVNTPGGVLPTPIGGTTWTLAQWNAAHADLVAWYVANMPGVWWGNAYPMEWGTTAGEITERAGHLAQCQAYAAAGLDGVMLENFPIDFTSSTINYLSQAEFDNALSFFDSLITAGLEVLCVAQGGATGTPWTDAAAGKFTAAVNMLLQTNPPKAYTRYTSATSGWYPQWWPVDAYWYQLGRPTAARQTSGTNPKVYSRTYQYGSVSISYPTSGAPTATITRTRA